MHSISHNPKVVSSSLTHATKVYITRTVTVLVVFYCLKMVAIMLENDTIMSNWVKIG